MPISLPSDKELELVVRTLPAAPRMLAELAPRVQALDTNVADITRILRRDSGLTARLIDVANSAIFTGFEPATSIEEAVSRLGYRETYRIVGAVASTQLVDEPLSYYDMSPRRLRENALFCALIMERLADPALLDGATAYTVGLLRSIGKTVLDRLARHAPGIQRFDATRQRITEWEHWNWGRTNAEIAAQVLELWQFPSEAIEAIRWHYAPDGGSRRSAHLLNIAAGTAELQGFGLAGEDAYWRRSAEALYLAGVDESRVARAAEHAQSTLLRLSTAFT